MSGSSPIPAVDDGDSPCMSPSNIARAPLPMRDVLRVEQRLGCGPGGYFVELMRRRLRSVLAVQERWVLRLCNQRHPRHAERQLQLRDFLLTVLAAFEEQFGPAQAITAPVRQRRAPSPSSPASSVSASSVSSSSSPSSRSRRARDLPMPLRRPVASSRRRVRRRARDDDETEDED